MEEKAVAVVVGSVLTVCIAYLARILCLFGLYLSEEVE